MQVTVIAAVGLSLAAAGSALAAERVSDSEFIKASRCRALAASDTLGPMDTSGLDAFLRTASRSRSVVVMNMAQDEQSRAKREAKNPERKSRLQAELGGACVAYLQPSGERGHP